MRPDTAPVQEAYTFAKHLTRTGCRETTVLLRLKNRGMGTPLARMLAHDAQESCRWSRRTAAFKHAVIGGLLCAAGCSGAYAAWHFAGNYWLTGLIGLIAVGGLLQVFDYAWQAARGH
jgi:hypothetical protein